MTPAAFVDAACAWALSPGVNRVPPHGLSGVTAGASADDHRTGASSTRAALDPPDESEAA